MGLGLSSESSQPENQPAPGDGDGDSTTVDELREISHYRLVRALGEGGMGQAFLAQDTLLRRPVCIKLLKAGVPGRSDVSRQVLREARAASALAHPNVAQIYEVGEAAGVPFIAMEFVEGQPLDRRLAERRATVDEAIELAAQVADALVEAGAKGIVHRDIKPANIIVTPRGQAKVLDFGVATLEPTAELLRSATTVGESTPGAIVGTVSYMSPEQASGRAVDHRSDLFSLGVVLYELLSGRRPFEADTLGEAFRRLLTEKPAPLSKFSKGIPPALERIVSKCLEKSPDRRYSSAAELLHDLRRLQNASMVLPPGLALASRRGRWVSSIAALILISALGVAGYRLRAHNAALASIGSIAVLPLVNSDAGTAFISDGLTESLISELSRLTTLRVMARSTVFRFKASSKSPVEIGKSLGVETVLVGDFTPQGDRLLLRAELVRVADGTRLWGNQYERAVTSLLEVQHDVATEIATSLRRTLTPGEVPRDRLERASEAYPLYLEGRFHWNQRTPSSLEKAQHLFEQAIAKDPGFALAYAGLADTYALLERYSNLPPSESRSRVQSAVDKALALDESLPEAHVSLASLQTTYDWNWPGAERSFVRALELSPSSATAHHWYALLLVRLARHEQARAEIERAKFLDPLSAIIHAASANIAFYGRRYDDSLADCARALELEPAFAPALLQSALSLSYADRHAEALALLEKFMNRGAANPVALAALGSAQARAGRGNEARATVRRLTHAATSGTATGYLEAVVWSALGEPESALAGLERAYAERSNWLGFVRVDPAFEALATEPRFVALARRIGLSG